VIKLISFVACSTWALVCEWWVSYRQGFSGPWYNYMFRFVVLFSYVIPLRYVLSSSFQPYTLLANVSQSTLASHCASSVVIVESLVMQLFLYRFCVLSGLRSTVE